MASTNGIEAGLSIYQSTTVVSVELNNGNKLSGMLNIEQGTVTLMQGRGEPIGTLYPTHPRINGFKIRTIERGEPPTVPPEGRILQPVRGEDGTFLRFEEMALP